MKKFYIQPNTKTLSVCFTSCICVGSIHGDSGLGYGGKGDPNSGGKELPM